jgi:GntR family transcriptional regulator / MocR family aminotransferase
MRPIYAARRDALLEGITHELGAWLQPIPSEAGLHLAARIRAPERAAAIIAKARQYAPGAQSIGDYALTPPEQPALTFGYGVIEADEIRPALVRLRRALESER